MPSSSSQKLPHLHPASTQLSFQHNLVAFGNVDSRYQLELQYTPHSTMAAQTHSHDGGAAHSHDFNAQEHGHSHEILDGPGSFLGREMPIVEGREWSERAFTIGIGG